MIKLQQSTQSFPAKDRAIARQRIGSVLREQNQIVLPLMRSLMKVVILDILGDGMPQRSLADEDHAG
jgi:hypothetical protein